VVLRPRKPSAAQNETVVKTCTQCGAVNNAEASICCFCDARLSQNMKDTFVSAGVPARTEGNLAVAPDWRGEVASRLEAYRARRKRLRADPAQPGLAFDDEHEAPLEREAPLASSAPPPAAAPPKPAARSASYASLGVERVEIDVTQPVLDFSGAASGSGPARANSPSAFPESPVFPVASLAERRRAALLDTLVLLFAYGGFLALFATMGGRFAVSKLDAVVVAATLGLFYAQYVALFTFFGGATPGMMLRRLRVVSFDGADPTAQQLLWRSFGYLISAGTLMLGFLAGLWDQDRLCWHDRISQTYLTPVEDAFSHSQPTQPAPSNRYERP
jgi:uncharacterized RDD family membrane protein YckC